MTIRNLESLFRPASIAIAGPNRLGEAPLRLLLERVSQSGFRGRVSLIGPPADHGGDLPEGISQVAALGDLPTPPDLLLLTGPPQDAAGIIEQAGAAGTRAAIALSAGYDRWDPEHVQAALNAARPNLLRLLGPGSLGIAAPGSKLAAHLGTCEAKPGDLAFIARSGTVVNATLSWAQANGTGFSGIVSLGQRTDIDASDLLDWFALDYKTRAILVHLETIANPRKFLSAARAAARSKPVVVLRSGLSRERNHDGVTHAGRIARPDAVFDAALARAGVLRVDDIDEMFEAAETVSRIKPISGRRLGIVATGGSLATLAGDQLKRQGGRLAVLGEDTARELAPLQRPGLAGTNPLTLDELAPPERYAKAAAAMLADRAVDAVLAVVAPSPFVDIAETANALASLQAPGRAGHARRKPLLVALTAGAPLPRAALDAARIPCHASASEAVRAFTHLARYAEAREMLMAAPPSLPADFSPDVETARKVVLAALERGESWLLQHEVREVLSAYGITQVESRMAASPEDAADMAREMLADADRLAMKIISPDLPFKSDVGGVVLDLSDPQEVEQAARTLLTRIGESHPKARISGIVLQPMVRHAHASEIFIGLADDTTFGPVIAFGHGGTGVEVMGDVALALPPLDLNLAQELISRTRVSKLLEGFRNRPRADLHAIALTLVKVSQIAVDIPEIREMDINPMAVDAHGVIALDARVAIAKPAIHPGRKGTSRLAILPYPQEWERLLTLKDGRSVRVGPVRPEDEARYRRFFEEKVSPEDLRLRFFAPVKEFSHAFMARLVQLDYARAMAFAASDPDTGEILGVVRLHADPDHQTGEYAIIVQSGLKGVGLGWALMQLIIDYAAADGIATIKGEVLKENTTMLAMCQALGFSVRPSPDDEAIAEVTLPVGDGKIAG